MDKMAFFWQVVVICELYFQWPSESTGSEFETTKRAGGSPEFLVVFSDPANSHPSRSFVNAGPSPALQRRGTQPGAGGHADLPANTHAAQGNGHLRFVCTVDKKTRRRLPVKLHMVQVGFLFHSSSTMFQTATGLPSHCRPPTAAAAVALRMTLPTRHFLPLPSRQVPRHPSHSPLKVLYLTCTKVCLQVLWQSFPFLSKCQIEIYSMK